MTKHFGNDLPEIIVEPGRSMVGDAGILQGLPGDLQQQALLGVGVSSFAG